MKRTLLVLILGTAAFFGVPAAYRAMASDESHIGWRLAEEVAAFNGASVLNLLPNFAADFRDTAGIDHMTLRGAVMWVWRTQRDADQRLAWHLELPEGAGEVAVEGDEATATFPLQLLERSGDDTLLLWGLHVNAKLQRRDGQWWITGSSHETVAGGRPGPSRK